ncbi:MAG TPA: hypothetical protein V6C52_10330 [Coleofasciculaceae cyanobacterium]|jgi:curli biogenesis system outer membrane secretion channel CsgG
MPFKRLFSVLLFSSIACLAANSWAETDPLSMTATGLSTTTKGLAEAASSVIVLPVKGVINTTSGAVMTVSGIGRGLTGMLDLAFDATGKFAEEAAQPLPQNLP